MPFGLQYFSTDVYKCYLFDMKINITNIFTSLVTLYSNLLSFHANADDCTVRYMVKDYLKISDDSFGPILISSIFSRQTKLAICTILRQQYYSEVCSNFLSCFSLLVSETLSFFFDDQNNNHIIFASGPHPSCTEATYSLNRSSALCLPGFGQPLVDYTNSNSPPNTERLYSMPT